MVTSDLFLGIAIFIASAVEAVEAITVILAVGITRGWRSVWYAVIAGLLTLTAIVAILGYSLLFVPLRNIWIIGGTILLIFGVQWIHKAILRYCGLKPERDELESYDKVRREAIKKQKNKHFVIDWYSFVITYKTVLLEGLEVIFIILAFGSAIANMALGIYVSIAAIIVVSAIAAILHKPLTKLPENSMKFVVGIFLATFGTVFASNGAGVIWPNEYAAFLFILALYLAVSVMTMNLISKHPKAKKPQQNIINTLWIFTLLSAGVGLFLLISLHNNPLPFFDVTLNQTKVIA